jgi:hypothetical protein
MTGAVIQAMSAAATMSAVDFFMRPSGAEFSAEELAVLARKAGWLAGLGLLFTVTAQHFSMAVCDDDRQFSLLIFAGNTTPPDSAAIACHCAARWQYS